jgi:hypothetical protein
MRNKRANSVPGAGADDEAKRQFDHRLPLSMAWMPNHLRARYHKTCKSKVAVVNNKAIFACRRTPPFQARRIT